MLQAGDHDDVVECGHGPGTGGDYDAAVVSDELPDGVRAAVVISLPDTRGSGGTGTVRLGGMVHEVTIDGAARVAELLNQYA
jgi:hypothetical protein